VASGVGTLATKGESLYASIVRLLYTRPSCGYFNWAAANALRICPVKALVWLAGLDALVASLRVNVKTLQL
jgi:hypothetical protein